MTPLLVHQIRGHDVQLDDGALLVAFPAPGSANFFRATENVIALIVFTQ